MNNKEVLVAEPYRWYRGRRLRRLLLVWLLVLVPVDCLVRHYDAAHLALTLLLSAALALRIEALFMHWLEWRGARHAEPAPVQISEGV